MLDNIYHRRLAADLPRWREKGWVTADGVTAIEAEIDTGSAAFNFATMLAVIGALPLGLAVVAFIAANWEGVPRLARFGLLVAGLALAFLAAYRLERRSLFAFGEAAFLVTGLIFAASIALIGQSYHLSSDFAGAVLYWEIGMITAAVLVRSPMLVAMALFGAGYWTYTFNVEYLIVPHYEGLALILAASGIGLWIGGAPTRVAAVFALFFWIGLTVLGLGDRLDWAWSAQWSVLLSFALFFWGAGAALEVWGPLERLPAIGGTLRWPALVAALVLVALVQFAAEWGRTRSFAGWLPYALAPLILGIVLSALAAVKRRAVAVDFVLAAAIGAGAILIAGWQGGGRIELRIAAAAIAVVASIWAVYDGETEGHRGVKALGLTAFGLEVLYVYAVTLGSVIDTALAFLLGGVLFIGLAALLYRVEKLLAARRAKVPA